MPCTTGASLDRPDHHRAVLLLRRQLGRQQLRLWLRLQQQLQLWLHGVEAARRVRYAVYYRGEQF